MSCLTTISKQQVVVCLTKAIVLAKIRYYPKQQHHIGEASICTTIIR